MCRFYTTRCVFYNMKHYVLYYLISNEDPEFGYISSLCIFKKKWFGKEKHIAFSFVRTQKKGEPKPPPFRTTIKLFNQTDLVV